MSVNVFSRSGVVEKGEWYDIASTALDYIFPLTNVRARLLIKVAVYAKSGLVTPIGNCTILSSNNTVLANFTTVDTDRGSTTNYSEFVTELPNNAARIRISANTPSYAYIEPIDLSPYPPLTPIFYGTTGSITVNTTSTAVLLGGGGGPGGYNIGSGGRFGAGSGFLATGTVNAGTYTLTIGAGGGRSSSGVTAGGSTNFAGITASGGSGNTTGGSAGGNAGSGSGNNGGVNGGGSGGSGVPAQFFTPGAVARGGSRDGNPSVAGEGGGLYGGGGGGASTNGADANGLDANGRGGGGGGGGAFNQGQRIQTGGAGAAGALWLVELN
jgi:hypothetical protein